MKKPIIILTLLLFLSIHTFSQTSGKLTVNFTTSTYSGSYSPKHILAVWITRSDGTFVKTLMAYTQTTKYRQYLNKWKTATSSSYSTVDAITGATLVSHNSLSCSWNCTDVSQVLQADGDYDVNIEFTESNASGKYAKITFSKGITPSSSYTNVTTSTNITGITIAWAPTNSAVDNIDYDLMYKIYPNPVSSLLFVSGSNIERVSVYDMQGKNILNTTENQINFSNFASGTYLIRIFSDKGIVLRTAIKK